MTYLHRCLDLFAETMQERHGSRPDYSGLESALEPVRSRRREFDPRDLETIQSPRYGDFRQFWRFPAEGEIGREIDPRRMSGWLQRLPLDEAETIDRLLAVFKYVQNVSVVLRFVHPKHYGILSPPVEKVLEVRRGGTESITYLNYLRDLRAVQEHHGFVRAADADMALWVLQERVLSSYHEPLLLNAFRSDTWLQRLRVRNILSALDRVEDRLDLAAALADVHATLAGMLAAAEYERRLRGAIGARGDERIEDRLDRYPGLGAARRREIEEGLRIRARLLDPAREATREEIRSLIDRAREIRGGAGSAIANEDSGST